MAKTTATAADKGLTTYTFTVVVEPDEDAWHAYCPALQGYGAATWGTSRQEALRHVREVVRMVVAELVEDPGSGTSRHQTALSRSVEGSSSSPRSAVRARDRRERTVPTGTSRMAAASS